MLLCEPTQLNKERWEQSTKATRVEEIARGLLSRQPQCWVNGKVETMVSISEGMIKIVKVNRRKRTTRLNQNGAGSRRLCFSFIISQPISFPVEGSHLKFHALILGTWKLCIAPSSEGKFPAKETDCNAGLGGWKKRMLCCNGGDTGLYLARKCADVQLVFHCERIE